MHRFSAFLAAALATVPAAAHADALQSQVLAAARTTPAEAFAFRRTLTIEATGQTKKTIVEQFDPRRAAADRWSLISVDGRAPTAKDLADHRKQKRGPTPGYARIAEWFGAPATRSDAGAGRVLYRFARLPNGTLKVGSHDASAATRAEALVNTSGPTPFVERFRFINTAGFRVMLVASVKSMTVDARYRQLPDGTVVPDDSSSVTTGSMMGKSGEMRTRTDYGAVTRVR